MSEMYIHILLMIRCCQFFSFSSILSPVARFNLLFLLYVMAKFVQLIKISLMCVCVCVLLLLFFLSSVLSISRWILCTLHSPRILFIIVTTTKFAKVTHKLVIQNIFSHQQNAKKAYTTNTQTHTHLHILFEIFPQIGRNVVSYVRRMNEESQHPNVNYTRKIRPIEKMK